MNGKGSKRRPEDQERIDKNWSRIIWRREKREEEKREWISRVVEDMSQKPPRFQ